MVRFLPWAEYAKNSLRQPTMGLTPFQCMLGYQPPLFPWSGEPSEVPAVNHWFEESEFMPSLTPNDGAPDWNISSTGKDTALRNVPGLPVKISWILFC